MEHGRKVEGMERVQMGIVQLRKDLYDLRYALLGLAVYYVLVHILFGQFCPMMIVLHFPCPGCGMTRALFLVLSGQWQQAWRLQPLVYGWSLLAILFAVNRYLLNKKPKTLTYLLIVLLLGTLILYVYRIYFGFPVELML